MLREDISTHPKYLAMMQAVIARRDERLKISDNLRVYEMKTLTTFAKARRSQILVQYKQQVRHLREEKLEDLGKQWYDIQHDRRSYGASVPEYTLKFPKARSQQVLNQVAYSNEVSILSGIAKYVGFPSAPPMAAATEQELADDFAKMGVCCQSMPLEAPRLTFNVAIETSSASAGCCWISFTRTSCAPCRINISLQASRRFHREDPLGKSSAPITRTSASKAIFWSTSAKDDEPFCSDGKSTSTLTATKSNRTYFRNFLINSTSTTN